MMKNAIWASACLVASVALSSGAWANALEMAPVGATWMTKCTGDNPRERTWTVVKNDGKDYRIEADDGSYIEGPLWGRAIGLNSEFEIAGGSGKITNELDGGDLEKVGALEIGASIVGYVRQSSPRGTFQHRHDVSVKEKAMRETPFGPVEAVLVVDSYGNNFWTGKQTVWYSPDLKAAISTEFESSRGQKSNCQLMTKPQ